VHDVIRLTACLVFQPLKNEQVMKFEFQPPLHIRSEDPEIYVVLAGQGREEGRHFVLHMKGKQIGFATALDIRDDKTIRREDGTKVWHIGVLGCSVKRDTDYHPIRP
jgi:hypothetical protein